MLKIKQSKKSINIKQPKIDNKIKFSNKYIRNDKDLYDFIKFLLERKKSKKRIQSIKKLKSDGKIINSLNSVTHEPIRMLPMQHNINQYRLIENEINKLNNDLNQFKRLNNISTSSTTPKTILNHTYTNPEAFELVRKVAKHRDIDAANELVKNVPEFKNMMEDLAELGASSAKEHIAAINKDISILEKNRNELDEHNQKLNSEIDELNKKITDMDMNKILLIDKLNDLQKELDEKEQEAINLNMSNQQMQNENAALLSRMDQFRSELNKLDGLYNATKNNLDKIQQQEIEMKTHIDDLNNVISEKEKEIEELRKLKEDAYVQSKINYKSSITANREKRILQINTMQVKQLRKELGIPSSEKYIKVGDLRNMLIEKEGLNESLDTPLSTPINIRKSSKSSISSNISNQSK